VSQCPTAGDANDYSYSQQPIFTTVGKMTDADKVMNPQVWVERSSRHPDPMLLGI